MLVSPADLSADGSLVNAAAKGRLKARLVPLVRQEPDYGLNKGLDFKNVKTVEVLPKQGR